MKRILITVLLSGMYSLIFCQPVPTAGLQIHYPFSGNSNDESGNGLHGINNGATLTDDRFGNPNSAYDFTVAGYIDCNNILNSVLSGVNTNFTFSFWVKPSSNNNNNVIIGKHADGGCSSNERQFFIRSYNNVINVEYFGSLAGTDGRFVCGTTTLTNFSKWYHIVVIYDGSINTNNGLDRVRIYVDNVMESTTLSCRTQSGSFPFDLVAGSAHMGIGNYLNNSGNPCLAGTRYNGKIDDIRMYDRILDGTEITQLFNEGTSGGVGIDPYEQSVSVHTYPNPAFEYIQIEISPLSTDAELYVENVFGQELLRLPVPPNITFEKQLSVNEYARGTYFLHLVSDGMSICVKKIILN